jgi:hypothetical protein
MIDLREFPTTSNTFFQLQPKIFNRHDCSYAFLISIDHHKDLIIFAVGRHYFRVAQVQSA